MAASVAFGNGPMQFSNHQQSNQLWTNAYNNIIAQFGFGLGTATVNINQVGDWGEGVWRGWIDAIQKKINALVVGAVDPRTCMITVMRVGPLQSTGVVGSERISGKKAGGKVKVSKAKVPRPPNSFIIYRKESHPEVVKAHPGMHNNEISKLIARKWKDETPEVKAIYKGRAEDARRQHAIDHPGYQYQPRKPSEKKKRMTKTKLAKFKAQANAASTSDATKDSKKMLTTAANDEQAATDNSQAIQGQDVSNQQPGQEVEDELTYDANDPVDKLIYDVLIDWRANHPHPPSHQLDDDDVPLDMVEPEEPYSFTEVNEIDDSTVPVAAHETMDVPQHEVLNSFTEVNDTYNAAAPTVAANASAEGSYDIFAGMMEEDRLVETALAELFDFETAVNLGGDSSYEVVFD